MEKTKLTVEEVMGRIKKSMSEVKNDHIVKDPVKDQDVEVDIQFIYDKLEMDLRNCSANRNIVIDHPIASHRKIIGPFLIFGKKLVKKYLSWYIDPPLIRQKDFNGSAIRSISTLRDIYYHDTLKLKQLSEKVDRLDKYAPSTSMIKDLIEENKKLSSDLESLELASAERLRRIERALSEKVEIKDPSVNIERLVHGDLEKHSDIDYFSFEERFRGSRESIKKNQQVYIDYFNGKKNVLDIGCGRGEFLELFKESYPNALVTGIDLNEDMVSFCVNKGLPALKGDIIEYLCSLKDGSVDGIFAAQVIEHLTTEALLKFLSLARVKLKEGGVLVLETINPQSLVALSKWFYIDPSHVKPVHPLTMQFMLESNGFKDVKFIYSSPATSEMIPGLILHDAHGNLDDFNRSMERLNELIYGPQDYATVCIKQ